MTEAPPPPDPNRPSEPNQPDPYQSQPPPPSGDPYSSAPPPPPPGQGYGEPAQGGYGAPQQGGYGAPQQGGYGAPQQGGYGAPQQGGFGVPQQGGALAEWPLRVYSAVIDWLAPFIVAGILYAANRPIGYVAYLAALGWALYNAYLGGQSGQSYGKKIAGTRLLSEASGQPPGGGLGIGRYFLHIVDGIPCYIGYLWPLWDAKKQTFADKIVKTVVVKL